MRVVGFLGLAYTLSFFIAAALRDRFGSELHDPGHEHLIVGLDGNLLVNAVMLVLISGAVVISIKPRQ